MNLLPQWNATDYQRKFLFPSLFLILGLFFMIISVNSILKSINLLTTINFTTSSIFVIYIIGRIYGELNVNKDFINITREGINYRETPGLAQGWLPSSKILTFEEVKSVDVVKIKNIFDPEKENMAIYLTPTKGKAIVMGSKLNNDQIMKVGLALKGSVAISNTLQRFLGEDSQVKEVIETAKDMWKSFTSKEE